MNRKLTWIGVIVLALLHQDFWWWDTRTLVFGILPVGLFYHVIFSLLAAGLWLWSVKYAWPDHLEQFATEAPAHDQSPGDTRP